MKPKKTTPQRELFGARLSELLNPEHPLYLLAHRIDWRRFDAAIDECYADELGRPGVNTRMMVGLMYLKHTFNESDESVVARWVECIAKGKAHKRYEFGCKASVGTTSRGNWIVGAKALHGNPYDGHTLAGAIEQIEQLAKQTPANVVVDQGYRGHNYQGEATVHVVRTIPKTATRPMRRMLKRRAAVEPTIGHLKSDNRLSRNHLTGKEGDRINVLLAAAGYNLRKLLRWLVFRSS